MDSLEQSKNRGQKTAIYETAYSQEYDELLLLADPEMQAIEKYIHRARLYVCRRCGAAVGVAAVTKESGDTYELKNIAVQPDMQNAGIGSMLVAHIKKEYNKSRLIVGTADTSEAIMRFYTRCGFVQYSVIKNFFVDHYAQPVFDNDKQCIDMIMLELKERE